MNMNSEQQYIDLYQSHRDTVHRHAPACMNAPRDRALEDLRREGFPTVASEYYKYTDMQEAFAPDYGLNLDRRPDNATIVITHYQRLLDYIKPDVVHVLYHGRIVKTGGPELALELEKKGYDWIKEENN